MEYSTPYPSSVPHVTLVSQQIQIDYQFYVSSLIIQVYFLFIIVALFGFSIYFRLGNYRLMIDQATKEPLKKKAQNIICQVIERNSFMEKNSDSSSDSNQKKSSYSNFDTEKAAPFLRLIERRTVYLVSYTFAWVYCVSLFGSSILLVIFGAVFLGVGIILNIIRLIPSWKITILLYIFPGIGSLSAFIMKEPLYEWKSVVDALEL